MKQADLVNQVLAGGIYCVGTYLSGRADTISIRDKTSGARRPAVVVRETIITDTDPIIISQWLPDNAKAENWKPQFKRGDKVAVKVQAMESNNGIPVLRGLLEILT